MSNENNFPARMKGLIDELRVEKDKTGKLKQENMRLEKVSMNSHERTILLEHTLRDMKKALLKK